MSQIRAEQVWGRGWSFSSRSFAIGFIILVTCLSDKDGWLHAEQYGAPPPGFFDSSQIIAYSFPGRIGHHLNFITYY